MAMLDLSSFNFFFVQPGFSKQRLAIFEKQIVKSGGKISAQIGDNTTHLIFNKSSQSHDIWSKKLAALDFDTRNCLTLIDSEWLSSCLKTKKLVDEKAFLIKIDLNRITAVDDSENTTADFSGKAKVTSEKTRKVSDSYVIEAPAKRIKLDDLSNDKSNCLITATQSQLFPNKNEDSDYDSSDDVNITSDDKEEAIRRLLGYDPKEMPKGTWVCTQSSKANREESGSTGGAGDRKQLICSKLEEMADNYEATGDKWRVYAYRKAVSAVRSHKKPICTFEEVSSIPGVGRKLGDKIWEIVEKGSFSKLDSVKNSEKMQIMNLFTNIHGVGSKTAEAWYAMGHRTLQDIKDKIVLSGPQTVGIDLYDDLVLRMPREEAAEIESFVRGKVHSIDPNSICEVCGSFRRGKPTCGDLDLLITTPDGVSHSREVFQRKN